MTQTSNVPWHRAWGWSLGVLVLLTLGIRFAEPVRDGDLWWQMAYGRYLIEHHTLIPDHTVFTWTPADGSAIYCAWLSEIFLYLLYQAGGLPALFAFRYLCLLIFVLAVWLQARRLDVAGHPMTWLICLLGVLMSQSAGYIKPEIFSYVFMTITVLIWWHIKACGKTAWRDCYLFPVLMVFWVNSHGGFIFGAAFLFVMGLGEALNGSFSQSEAFPPGVRRHLFIGLFLSGLAIFVTPYGWRYPAYLIPSLLGKTAEGLRVVRAYVSTLDPSVAHYHYRSYLFLAALILLGLMWHKLKRRRLDWALILTNLTFAFLYTRFLRTTYYWAPIFCLSAVHLLAYRATWSWPKGRAAAFGLGGAVAVGCVLLGARASFDAVCRPYGPRWFGFGVSYQNPVEEAAFIRTNFSASRLGNDYSGGGYLLWALWPDMKVFMDPRKFPFKGWLDQYSAFHSGRKVGDFVENFPCEVWCIRYECRKLITWFLRSSDWKVAFYGPSAAVFAREDVPLVEEAPQAGQGIGKIKNITQALFVFTFAVTIHDWDNARIVLASMRECFSCPEDQSHIQAASDWLAGTLAYFRRDYEKAAVYLEACRRGRIIQTESLLAKCYNHLTVLAWSKGDDPKALGAARAALAVKPGDPYALFNAGVIEWYLSERLRTQRIPQGSPDVKATDRSAFQRRAEWRRHLQAFVREATRTPRRPRSAIDLAQGILRGTYDGRPILARPAEPPLLADGKGVKRES
jgi:hypothetical protein